MTIAALLSPPLAAAAGAFVTTAGEAAIDGVALSGVGPALADTLIKIADDDRLVADLFRHTLRDDKPLSEVANRDAAFSRNYREEERAIFEIVRYNRFITAPAGFATGSTKISAALGKMFEAAVARLAGRLDPASTPEPEGSGDEPSDA